MVELLSFDSVDDVSLGKDGSVRKRTVVKGDGWERPREPYVLIIDLAAIGASEAASGTCKHLEVTIGSVGACSAVQQLAKTCGISDLVQVLERVLIRMQKDETSEVTRHPPKGAGTDGSDTVESPMTVTVTLHSWLRVETVPHVGQEVVRREMVRVDDSARPMAFSTVEVLYTVREKAAAGAPMGSGRLIESTGSDTPRKFVVNEGPSRASCRASTLGSVR